MALHTHLDTNLAKQNQPWSVKSTVLCSETEWILSILFLGGQCKCSWSILLRSQVWHRSRCMSGTWSPALWEKEHGLHRHPQMLMASPCPSFLYPNHVNVKAEISQGNSKTAMVIRSWGACWHLNLIPRTVREWISVVWDTQLVVICNNSSRELTHHPSGRKRQVGQDRGDLSGTFNIER